jgi:hypothetical protein
MNTVELVYQAALGRYGVVRVPQLAAVYAALPGADPVVARRVDSTVAPAAMVAVARQLDDAEARVGPAAEDLLRINLYDPQCGVGMWLVLAAQGLANRYARRLTTSSRRADRLAGKVLPEIILTCVSGMDTDPLAVDLARLALSLHTGGRLTPQALRRHIVCGDYTRGDVPPAKRTGTDIVDVVGGVRPVS